MPKTKLTQSNNPAGVQAPRSFEDYLEAMLRLQEERAVARVSELAVALGVHKSTVTATLKMLAARGLVVHSRYSSARLTPAGAAAATRVGARHTLIRGYLLRMLLVEPDVADANACRMEHILDADIIARLEDAARFARVRPRAMANWRRGFRAFMARSGGREATGAGDRL